MRSLARAFVSGFAALAFVAAAAWPACAARDSLPPNPGDPSWLPLAAACAAIVPGGGHLLLGDPWAAALDFGATALPTTLAVVEAPPIIFADLPEQRVSMWALTAQEAWSLQIYGAYRDARVRTDNAGYPQPLVPRSAPELIAAPFQWAQLSDDRVWLLVAAGLLENIALALVLPEPPSNSPSTPSIFSARSAELAGVRVSPAVGYGAHLLGSGVLAAHAGVGEEALFRGVLQDEFERSLGPWGGLAAASAAFGAVHVGGINQTTALKQFVGPGLMGALLGYLYQSSGYDLAKPVAAHTYYDLIAFGLSGLFPMDAGNNVFGIRYAF